MSSINSEFHSRTRGIFEWQLQRLQKTQSFGERLLLVASSVGAFVVAFFETVWSSAVHLFAVAKHLITADTDLAKQESKVVWSVVESGSRGLFSSLALVPTMFFDSEQACKHLKYVLEIATEDMVVRPPTEEENVSPVPSAPGLVLSPEVVLTPPRGIEATSSALVSPPVSPLSFPNRKCALPFPGEIDQVRTNISGNPPGDHEDFTGSLDSQSSGNEAEEILLPVENAVESNEAQQKESNETPFFLSPSAEPVLESSASSSAAVEDVRVEDSNSAASSPQVEDRWKESLEGENWKKCLTKKLVAAVEDVRVEVSNSAASSPHLKDRWKESLEGENWKRCLKKNLVNEINTVVETEFDGALASPTQQTRTVMLVLKGCDNGEEGGICSWQISAVEDKKEKQVLSPFSWPSESSALSLEVTSLIDGEIKRIALSESAQGLQPRDVAYQIDRVLGEFCSPSFVQRAVKFFSPSKTQNRKNGGNSVRPVSLPRAEN